MKHRSIIPFALLTASLFLNCDLFIDEDVSGGSSIDCNGIIDEMYDENCEMWCENIAPDDWEDATCCTWWTDAVSGNYDKDDAEDVCEEMVEEAEKEDCLEELDDWLQCSVDNNDDVEHNECADDCRDEGEEFYDCID